MNNNFKKYIIVFLSFITVWLIGIPFIFSKVLPVVCENISHIDAKFCATDKFSAYDIIPNGQERVLWGIAKIR